MRTHACTHTHTHTHTHTLTHTHTHTHTPLQKKHSQVGNLTSWLDTEHKESGDQMHIQTSLEGSVETGRVVHVAGHGCVHIHRWVGRLALRLKQSYSTLQVTCMSFLLFSHSSHGTSALFMYYTAQAEDVTFPPPPPPPCFGTHPPTHPHTHTHTHSLSLSLSCSHLVND